MRARTTMKRVLRARARERETCIGMFGRVQFGRVKFRKVCVHVCVYRVDPTHTNMHIHTPRHEPGRQVPNILRC